MEESEVPGATLEEEVDMDTLLYFYRLNVLAVALTVFSERPKRKLAQKVARLMAVLKVKDAFCGR